MKEPKNLKELRDNLQSSFDKASVKPDSNSQVRARVYEIILNSVNKILSVPSHETPKVGNNEKAKEVCPVCNGKGKYFSEIHNNMQYCSECYGTGYTG